MKSQSSPIYTYEDMQEVKEHYRLREMFYQLGVLVAIVAGYLIGLFC